MKSIILLLGLGLLTLVARLVVKTNMNITTALTAVPTTGTTTVTGTRNIQAGLTGIATNFEIEADGREYSPPSCLKVRGVIRPSGDT